VGEARCYPKTISCSICNNLSIRANALRGNKVFFEYKKEIFMHMLMDHPECIDGMCVSSKKKRKK